MRATTSRNRGAKARSLEISGLDPSRAFRWILRGELALDRYGISNEILVEDLGRSHALGPQRRLRGILMGRVSLLREKSLVLREKNVGGRAARASDCS